MRTRVVECDSLVIGSGAGGSVAAAELAKAGRDVVLLEEGPRLSTEQIAAANPAHNLRRLYRNGGLVPMYGRPNIPFGEARCVGGTTVINGGLLWAPPAHLLDRWADESGVRSFHAGAVSAQMARVESRLGVVDQPHGDGNLDSVRLAEGAQDLGWHWRSARRAIRGCRHRNRCVTGCPSGAKQSMLATYLQDAEAHGCRTVPDTRVVHLEHEGGVVRAVHAVQRGRRAVVYRPRSVFLAAGPMGSPALLQRSGIHRATAGKQLGFHVNLRTIARFAEPVEAWRGTIFTGQLQEFSDRGVLVMPANLTPGSLGAALTSHGPDAVNRVLDDLERIAVFTTQVRVTSPARVRHVRGMGTVVSHALGADDHELLRFAWNSTARMLFRAGATELYPPVPGTGAITGAADAERSATTGHPSTWDLVSVHAMASCRIGTAGRGGVCDDRGRPHGFANLRLCDASVLPGATGISPQGTIMAFAHEIVDRYLDEDPPQRRSPVLLPLTSAAAHR